MNGSAGVYIAWEAQSRSAWEIRPTLSWLTRNDNGHTASIGFMVGHDITWNQIRALERTGRAKQVDYDKAMAPRRW